MTKKIVVKQTGGQYSQLITITRICSRLNTEQRYTNHNRRSKMATRIVEIRAAEGGEDAALFVADLAAAYQRMFSRVG